MLQTLVNGRKQAMTLSSSPPQLKESYDLKTRALKKVWSIIIVVTLTSVFQIIGFIFTPLSMVDHFMMSGFHICYNISITVLVVLYLYLYGPVKEFQQLFEKRDSKDLTTIVTAFDSTGSERIQKGLTLSHASPVSPTDSEITSRQELFQIPNSLQSIRTQSKD